ncbi:TetR family transcriptional regulator [Nocardia cyriacigeorgica]|uniref:TetR/AcrR family transcriptional regulator n=1 Tax=Nocardia cyriacigeorgica TaxID=135487 RepID=UPI0002EEFBA2|nr:TetR family transcriptional regulator [Nocardia cyriacigeorgica]MBF6097339.1 TetR family transcriptional regulator [Nocardia cyriacigeorgica]MBF6160917.1 TetR family transcriptional regulator [Nocardia cyriacigeorgica]MBF6201092.1 TetR family transcriptional regulator [Nocardia cyriacigeorgica]MBF6318753.1 TetR family transcriptional regulator [Nocardia cyriacigeorgica]MBF6344068.1 TetR family transcriptional regulator [Nocardia cyriacigeorgica]
MSEGDSIILEATRRRLTEKQADTVDKLTKAAVEVLAREGFAGMTIRMVAAAAGVGTATAYTYFSSKEHLVAEIFWRRLAASPSPVSDDPDPKVRVVAELRNIAMLVADEQQVSGAVTSALLGRDPDVAHLRGRIGSEIRKRIVRALGPDADDDVVESLELLYAGALVRAGMGYGSYSEIADRIEKSALLILG